MRENFYELSFPMNFGIGFDDMFDRFTNIANTQTGSKFPPYNIINESETQSIIEMAVAGFDEHDLDIEVEDSKITIKGNRDVKLDDVKYQHQGIAYRNFTRTFALADHIQVNGASVDCGILRVYLERIVPDDLKPRKIEIMSDRQFLSEEISENDGDESK